MTGEQAQEARVRKPGDEWTAGIVGAGITGLAVARELAARGVTCEIFDPAEPGSGQSRGDCFIFALPGWTREAVHMHLSALRGWERWERQMGIELLDQRGVAMFGPQVVRMAEELKRAAPEAAFVEIHPSTLDRSVRPREGNDPEPTVLDRTGGMLWPRRTIDALAELFPGVPVRSRVTGLEQLSDGRAALVTDEGRHEYDAIVVAAGAGTPALAATVGLTIDTVTTPFATVQFPVRERFVSPSSIGFVGETPAGDYVFGGPEYDGRRYTFHLASEAAMQGEAHESETKEILTERLVGWVADRFETIEPEPVEAELEWSTGLRWRPPFRVGIGVWRRGNVIVPAGGPMFGGVPVLAELLADAAEGMAVPEGVRPESEFGRPPDARTATFRQTD